MVILNNMATTAITDKKAIMRLLMLILVNSYDTNKLTKENLVNTLLALRENKDNDEVN